MTASCHPPQAGRGSYEEAEGRLGPRRGTAPAPPRQRSGDAVILGIGGGTHEITEEVIAKRPDV
jgi:hypothetical protein